MEKPFVYKDGRLRWIIFVLMFSAYWLGYGISFLDFWWRPFSGALIIVWPAHYFYTAIINRDKEIANAFVLALKYTEEAKDK
jgi:hypothetical protein